MNRQRMHMRRAKKGGFVLRALLLEMMILGLALAS